MNRKLKQAELFEGALVRHADIDAYFAIILNSSEGELRVADIYGFFESEVKLENLTAIQINPYLLRRMGFERQTMESGEPFFFNGETLTSLFPRRESDHWTMITESSETYHEYIHELQRVIYAIHGVILTARRDVEDKEEGGDD